MLSFDDSQQRFVLLLAAGAALQVALDEGHEGGGVITAGGALAELVDQLVHGVAIKVIVTSRGRQACQASRGLRADLRIAPPTTAGHTPQPPPESAR